LHSTQAVIEDARVQHSWRLRKSTPHKTQDCFVKRHKTKRVENI